MNRQQAAWLEPLSPVPKKVGRALHQRLKKNPAMAIVDSAVKNEAKNTVDPCFKT
jgi:hypothetical protein